MLTDETTFLLGFLAIFGGLAYYLWAIERRARRLERRLDTLQALATEATEGRDA